MSCTIGGCENCGAVTHDGEDCIFPAHLDMKQAHKFKSEKVKLYVCEECWKIIKKVAKL